MTRTNKPPKEALEILEIKNGQFTVNWKGREYWLHPTKGWRSRRLEGVSK